jgi:predicted Zn-dependent peptidase
MLSEVNVLSRALNLAWYELLGSADMMALVLDEYMGVTADQVRRVAQRTFADGFYSELRYAPTAPS